MKAPTINSQTREEVLQAIQQLAKNYLREWSPSQGDPAWAIAQSFADMNDGVNSALNRVPHKLFLSYLDFLGFRQSPPLFAKVPITFELKEKFNDTVIIPQGTQLQSKNKLNYETDTTFTATSAKFSAIFDVDTIQNRVSNLSSSLLKKEPFCLFTSMKQEDGQYLYFGDDNLFNIHHVKGDVNSYIKYTLSDIETKMWQYWGQDKENDTPRWINFTGDRTTLNKEERYTSLKKEINGVESFWIRALLTPPLKEQVSNYNIAYKSRNGIDGLYYNTQPIDPKKTIFPFGKKPQEHDKFYISSSEAFSKKGALCGIFMKDISCDIQNDGTVLFKETYEYTHKGYISIEYFNGKAWKKLTLIKETKLSEWVNNGVNLRFNIPQDIDEVNINGDTNFWIRLELVTNEFGRYLYNKDANKVSPSFNPPSFESLDIYIDSKQKTPQHILRYAHQSYTNLVTSHNSEPYSWLEEDDEKILYLGFDKPLDQGLTSILFSLEKHTNINYLTKWSYFTQKDIWQELPIKDATNSFTNSGVCNFGVPQNQQHLNKFGKDLYWLRISFYPSNPLSKNTIENITFNAIHLNTIMATQCTSIKKKLLGSSDGSAFQEFKIEEAPIMQVMIWVKENTIPIDAPYYEDEFNEGYWVQWSEVNSFNTTTQNKRVYTVDSHSAKVLFCDTKKGSIPPIGTNNILVSYKVGGGVQGNIDKHNIDKLANSIAYIDKITNYEEATGGADEQSIESLIKSAPNRIKHQNRAVTLDDYEALVYEASSNISKVKVNSHAGLVELIILPHSELEKPILSETLKSLVKEYISKHSSATVSIEVKEPRYIDINISLNIVVDDWSVASSIKNSIQVQLDNFLHPLKGGMDLKGWKFDELPTLYHIFNLLNKVEGIAYFKEAEISMENQVLYDLDGQKHTNIGKDFIIVSGKHSINIELRSTT